MTGPPPRRPGRTVPGRTVRGRPLLDRDLAELDGCPGCPPLTGSDPRVQAAMERWGWCGVLARSQGRPSGHLVLVPVELPHGAEAARIVRLHPVSTVEGEARTSEAVTRRLIETAAARLLRQGVPAVQARAHRWAGDCEHPPLALLAGRGFVVVRQHAVHPVMQLDLDRTLPGEPTLGHVWQRLSQLVRSPPPPEPIGFREQTRPRASAP